MLRQYRLNSLKKRARRGPDGGACRLARMAELGLDDLIANGTMSPEIGETLRATARGRHPFLVTAVPRLAGKSTVMRAMLAHAPKGSPIRTLGIDGDDLEPLLAPSRGGYFVVPEISRGAWAPGYVWGAPVRRAFQATADGRARASARPAPDLARGVATIWPGNRGPDEDA